MTEYQFCYICMILAFILGNTTESQPGEWMAGALGMAFGIGACIAAYKERKQ